MDVLKEVKRIKNECHEVEITPTELCRMIGVKPGLIGSWKARAVDLKYQPRASIVAKVNAKLKELRAAKDSKDLQGMRETKARPVLQVVDEVKAASQPYIFDDREKAALEKTLQPTGHQVLKQIILDRLCTMSLVQLALLLAHMEQGNGK